MRIFQPSLRGPGRTTFTAAATLCLAIALLSAPPVAQAAGTKVTYARSDFKVKHQKMTLWTKPTDDGGAIRITQQAGDLWFSEQFGGVIIRFQTTGVATVFPIDGAPSINAVTAGPDGNVWFSALHSALVGRVQPNGKITQFPAGSTELLSNEIVTGPDNNLWFATDHLGIGRMTTADAVTFFNVKDNDNQLTGITVGPDGNIWYVEWGNPNGAATPRVGRIKTSGSGLKEFNVGFGDFSNSFGIATGSDGNVWFCDPQHNRISRIKPDGTGLVHFKRGLHGQPLSIINGPDGNLYFGEDKGIIGKITTAGTITEYPIPGFAGTSNFAVLGLTVGPDGDIWFVNSAHAVLGRLAP